MEIGEKKRTLFACVDLCHLFESVEKDRGEKMVGKLFPDLHVADCI